MFRASVDGDENRSVELHATQPAKHSSEVGFRGKGHHMFLIIVIWTRLVTSVGDPFLQDIPAFAVPTETSPKAKKGLATMYGTSKDKKWGGGHLACAPDYQVQTLPTMNVCAHRTYRCGTIMAVENVRTKKRTLCRVLDRGPYGALLEDGTWVLKIRADDPGTWRGIADLTPSVAAAIGHSGYEQVRTWAIYIPAKKLIVKPVKKKKTKRAVHVVRPNV